MAGYLSCITVGGGVPMFTRRVGDLKAVIISILYFAFFIQPIFQKLHHSRGDNILHCSF